MTAAIILTVIGKDRPGLVRALAEKVAAQQGSWLESRMARLAGQFAGIVQVSVPEAGAEALIDSLKTLETEGLRLTVMRDTGEAPVPAVTGVTLELMGHDHPGIVRDIAQALATRGVNIEELETEVVSGAWSGDQLFRATARLRMPGNLKIEELRAVLERLAQDLMVDLTLDDKPRQPAKKAS